MSTSCATLSQPHLLGIDEAGRGPVLGPMVYAYAACPVSAQAELAGMGFADSKALNSAQREALLAALEASPLLRRHTVVLSPQQLSADMQRASRVSLNVLSHDAAIALIRHALDHAGLRLAEVFVDTVGDPASYAAKLQSLFPAIRFTVSAKADSLFPIVSAASIVAKCARDDAVRRWRFSELRHSAATQQQPAGSERAEEEPEEAATAAAQTQRKRRVAALSDADSAEDNDLESRTRTAVIDRDMGSGYPGDPATKRWLARHVDAVFGFPAIVRFSWATARQLLQTKAYAVTWHDALDDEQTADERDRSDAATQRLEHFMSTATASSNSQSSKAGASRTVSTIASRERFHYFQQRRIDILTSLT